jgi:hypothetical protein
MRRNAQRVALLATLTAIGLSGCAEQENAEMRAEAMQKCTSGTHVDRAKCTNAIIEEHGHAGNDLVQVSMAESRWPRKWTRAK